MCRVGQNHIYTMCLMRQQQYRIYECMLVGEYLRMARTIHLYVYTVYIRYFWLGNHQMYGVSIRKYTVLANPTYVAILPT